MAFYKEGTPNKIVDVTNSDSKFEQLRQKIASENNLIRCPSCDHLLAKKSADGELDLQHKRASLVVTKAESVKMQCPVCRTVSQL